MLTTNSAADMLVRIVLYGARELLAFMAREVQGDQEIDALHKEAENLLRVVGGTSKNRNLH